MAIAKRVPTIRETWSWSLSTRLAGDLLRTTQERHFRRILHSRLRRVRVPTDNPDSGSDNDQSDHQAAVDDTSSSATANNPIPGSIQSRDREHPSVEEAKAVILPGYKEIFLLNEHTHLDTSTGEYVAVLQPDGTLPAAAEAFNYTEAMLYNTVPAYRDALHAGRVQADLWQTYFYADGDTQVQFALPAHLHICREVPTMGLDPDTTHSVSLNHEEDPCPLHAEGVCVWCGEDLPAPNPHPFQPYQRPTPHSSSATARPGSSAQHAAQAMELDVPSQQHGVNPRKRRQQQIVVVPDPRPVPFFYSMVRWVFFLQNPGAPFWTSMLEASEGALHRMDLDWGHDITRDLPAERDLASELQRQTFKTLRCLSSWLSLLRIDHKVLAAIITRAGQSLATPHYSSAPAPHQSIRSEYLTYASDKSGIPSFLATLAYVCYRTALRLRMVYPIPPHLTILTTTPDVDYIPADDHEDCLAFHSLLSRNILTMLGFRPIYRPAFLYVLLRSVRHHPWLHHEAALRDFQSVSDDNLDKYFEHRRQTLVQSVHPFPHRLPPAVVDAFYKALNDLPL